MRPCESAGPRVLVVAARVLDAEGRGGGRHGPGAVLLGGGSIVAAGAPSAIGRPVDARVMELPAAVVVPALVNAHCHLDLSHLEPSPYEGDFVGWIDAVRRGRATDDAAIAASMRRGLALARSGGTAFVGDIAGFGSTIPLREIAAGGMAGVSFLEVLGAGAREAAALEAVARIGRAAARHIAGPVRAGISPHAPYTCSEKVYRAAAALGLPVSTHLAESPEEEQLLTEGGGPLAAYLEPFGFLDDAPQAGRAHPIDLLADVLASGPVLAAHVNYLRDAHLDILARTRTTVAYCPRANAYFGHPRDGRPAHGYRRMIEAGINVALGTDGLRCLDTPDRISVLDEMRLLHRRDGTDFVTALGMATVAGARGLGFDPCPVTLAAGPTAGMLALPFDPADPTDPLVQVMQRDDPPQWIYDPQRSGQW